MGPTARKANVRTGRGATKKIGGVDVPGDPLLDCERHPPSKLFPVSELLLPWGDISALPN